MQYLFIDESGTMTKEYANHFPFFVICVINVLDKETINELIKKGIIRPYFKFPPNKRK